MKNNLLNSELQVINIGLDIFPQDLEEQNVPNINLSWRPPAGDKKMLNLLTKLESSKDRISEANEKAIEIVQNGQPVLMDILPAHEVISGMDKYTLLHAGPPVGWENMCGPMRAGVFAALKYEGLAKDDQEAENLLKEGKIKFASCNDFHTVGPMTGITSYSMPLYVVENKTYGNFSYTTINEGMGKVLRFGANSQEVVDRLKWIENELAPELKKAIQLSGGLNLKVVISQAVTMGDELHMRNAATAALYVRYLSPLLAEVCTDQQRLIRILKFISINNDQIFLNLAMAAGKATLEAAHNIPGSTLVTIMARNGYEFGIKVSGLGDQWFTAPANRINGLYFSGYSQEDANPDMGDSAIMETYSLGGFAMATAPAIIRFLGTGTAYDAFANTHEMYEITLAENRQFIMPNLNFRGTPTGIDILKVVESGIEPIINTAISHKEPGVGMIGAGMARAPKDVFIRAFQAFAENMENSKGKGGKP